MRAGRVACLALAVAVTAGCERKAAAGTIPRERFVLANAALRAVPDTAAAGDSLRAAALKRHRVTDRDLLRFVQVHGTRVEYMSTVWREIADSVQRRYERSHRAGRSEGLPPGMNRPDMNQRVDSIVRPSGEPTVIPPPPPPGAPPALPVRRPRPPPAGTVPPVMPRREPPVRTPSPPTDRGPMTPPAADSLKRTPAP